MPITLTVTRGPETGRSQTFTEHDTFLIGRSATAHASYPKDPYLSRFHFLIEINPPLCRISDLDSRNGTLVNAKRVATVDLVDGDEIEAGETVFKVTIPASASEETTRDLPAREPVSDDPTGLFVPDDSPKIPGYRDFHEIGCGGMGVVYQAVDAATGKTVAIKTIKPAMAPKSAAVARFLREAEILRTLQHPKIVPFHASGEANGLLFFVMEFIPGIDAAKLVKDRGALPVVEVIELAGQMCEGLMAAHARGFVHRDIKPANLLLEPLGSGWNLRIADFGLARTYQDSPMSGLSVAGASAGTPAFMAPEQITDFRNVRPAADQYAAAAAVFFLLTGQFLFEGSGGADLLKKVLEGKLAHLEVFGAKLPPKLVTVLRKALAIQPTDRYPDVKAFAAALRSNAS